jgi:hypothetical protein
MSALEDLTNRSNWDIQGYLQDGERYTNITWLVGKPPFDEAAAELARLRAIEAAARDVIHTTRYRTLEIDALGAALQKGE